MPDIDSQSCCGRCQGKIISIYLLPCSYHIQYTWLKQLQVLFLPEASDYIASSAEESLALARSPDCGNFIAALQKAAKGESMHINVGIHEVASEERLKNSLVWIDDKGTITQNYQKVHLFDVEIKDGPILKESKCVNTPCC
jgi:predicted amidohydrolase